MQIKNTAARPGAIILAVLLFKTMGLSAQGPTTPQVPASAQTQQPGSPAPDLKRTDRLIYFYQGKVKEDPTYWISYDKLAMAYVLKSRETGDISYLELAEISLRKSLELESTHGDAAVAYTDMAVVHLSEHRFEEASVDADHAIAINGETDVTAFPYAADAQLEFGNYDAAKTLYERAIEVRDGKPHPDIKFLVLSHGSGLDWIEGKDKQASDEMRKAVKMAEDLHLPAENVAWTHFMIGEQMFQAGDLAVAETEEEAALAAFPRYHRALEEMGKIRAAQHRLNEAVAYDRQALAIIPLPVYAATLGDVYTAMGNKVEAEKQYSLVEYIAKLSALSAQVFNRELVYFYADHDRKLPLAVALAKKELEVRHDIYTSDAMAWALYKSGNAQAARDPMEKAIRFGTKDALLEYHAGMIYARLGEKAQAASHFERALALNPNFHVLYASSAQRELASLRSSSNAASASIAPAK